MDAAEMKIAVVFSDYRKELPSGEREVVRNECAALKRAGIEAHLVSASTDEGLRDPLYPLRAAGRVATGFGGSPLDRIRDLTPDVVHVHNLFPNFGSRWLAQLDLPLVVTLHNYRTVCAEGSLFRESSPCTLCPDGARLAGLRHRCYRDSVAATLPLAVAMRRGLAKHPLISRATLILVPSDFHRDLLISYGLDPRRSRTSPNFVPMSTSSRPPSPVTPRSGWLYAGRLDAGKGVLPLIQQWPQGERLTVVGDGPLHAEAVRAAGPDVHVVGQQPRASVDRLLQESEGLIFPSRHFESQPLVYLEALRAGTPVVALEGNAVARAVSSEGTGVTYGQGVTITAALSAIRTGDEEIRARCLQTFEEKYTERVWQSRRSMEYAQVLAGQGEM